MKYFTLILLVLLPATSNAYVLGGTAPGKWGTPGFGTGATVTYSFMGGGEVCDDGNCSALSDFMPAGFQAEIVRALDAWSAVADITFNLVADDGADWNTATTSGDIRFGGETFDGQFGTLAHGYYPPDNGFTAAGDIHFDIAEAWKIGFGGPGFDIFTVAAHEIGHAIGLDHTAVAGSLMNPSYTEAFAGLQADDIAGAQFIYGPAAVPVPAAIWLFASAMLGLVGMRKKSAFSV